MTVTDHSPASVSGRVDLADRTVHFVEALAGFPDLRDFVLQDVDGSGLLYALRCVDEPSLRFLVVPPAAFFPDYSPDIADSWGDRLGVPADGEVALLVVVTPGAVPADSTANLLAPLVVEPGSGRAAQVVLDDTRWSLRQPLLAVDDAAGSRIPA